MYEHVSQPISLVLIDDNRSSREGVVAIIREQPGFHVLAASTDIEGALRAVRETRPDVVLLDLGQEDVDRVTLAGALHGDVPESRVIIMGLEPAPVDVASLVRAGVSGFIMAGASFDRFLRTIHSVARGIQVLPPELTRPLFRQLKWHGVRERPKRTLGVKRRADRERRVAVSAFSQDAAAPAMDALPPTQGGAAIRFALLPLRPGMILPN